MADIHIKESDITYDYLSYPFGSFGDMLLIRANIPGDMNIGDYLYFDNEGLFTNKVITINTTSNITASHPVPGSYPVEYVNSAHAIDLSSFTDDNLQKIENSNYGYEFYPKGETYLNYNKAAYVDTTDHAYDPEEGDYGAYNPLVGWLALYSVKLDRYINYRSFLTGGYPTWLHKYTYKRVQISSAGFVFGESPYDDVSGSVFEQSSNPSSSKCGIGKIWVFPFDLIFNEWGLHGQGVISEESVISKIFAGRDPIDIDPDKPDEPSSDDNKGSSPNDHLSLPDGDYNYEGDEINDDGTPDDNPNSMGTMGLWAPSRNQYKDFCHYLWNGFQQAMVGAFGNNDGMQCILACKEYPFVIKATKNATMALGKVDTKLTVDVAPGNYFAIVFKGTVKHPSNSFMDYSPYSKLSVYLPYIGITDLDIDQVSGREVTITYKIDIVSGIGVVLISTVDDNKKNIIIGSYPVQMGKELPVTATDYQRVAQSWAGIAMTAGAVTAGIGLPMMSGMTMGAIAERAMGAVAGSAGQAANSTKADIKQSGSLGGCSGMLGISYPYFIYKMTNFSNSGYKGLIGKKSSAVVKLSTLKGSGFNKIEAVNIHIEGATDEELTGIKNDLLSGVTL